MTPPTGSTAPAAPALDVAPSRPDSRDWTYAATAAERSALPESADLRPTLPPAFDQGATNTCTAQAMAAAVHRAESAGGRADPELISRLLLYWVERGDDSGSGRVPGQTVQMRDCLKAVSGAGCAPESLWPYDLAKIDVAPPADLLEAAAGYRVTGYARVPQTLDHLRAALAGGLPFVFGIRVFASFPGYTTRGVADVRVPSRREPQLGGHALLAVGYDDARSAFLVRNSWGEAWGDGGHCWLPYAYLTDPYLSFDHWMVSAVQHDERAPDATTELRNAVEQVAAAATAAAAAARAAAASADAAAAAAGAAVAAWRQATAAPDVARARATDLPGTGWTPSPERKPAPEQPRPAGAEPTVAGPAPAESPAPAPADQPPAEPPFLTTRQPLPRRWPSAAGWCVTTPDPATSGPAVSADGVVAVRTTRCVSAVDVTGNALWQSRVPEGASAPVAVGNAFVVAVPDGVLLLPSRTGEPQPLPAFEGMELGDRPVAPAVDAGTIVVAARTGEVRVADLTGSRSDQALWVGADPTAPVMNPLGWTLVAGAGQRRTVVSFVPFDPTPARGHRVSADLHCGGYRGVVAVVDGVLTALEVPFEGEGQDLVPRARSERYAVGAITGLLAVPQHDLCVLTLNDGRVAAVSLTDLSPRWETTLPVASTTARSSSVHPAALDADGRVVCTTATGQLSVLDPATGSVLGGAALGRRFESAPVSHAGTVFATAQDPGRDLPSSLHALPLGRTPALRLNVDADGSPAAEPRAYGRVRADDAALSGLDPTAATVEAWLNLPPGGSGGVLHLCPAVASGVDLSLAVTPGGGLRFASARPDAAGGSGDWAGVVVTAETALADGEWHHVAVVRRPGTGTTLLVDGALTPVVETARSAAPPTLVAGLQVYLGAAASADLGPVDLLRGMLGDVRVWGRSLSTGEIAARSGVRLRGDEPELLAYWDFATGSVDDRSRLGADGVVVAGHDAWQLTDLELTAPAYPQVTTAVTGGDGAYVVTATARRADGRPLAGCDLALSRPGRGGGPGAVVVDGSPLRAGDEPLRRRTGEDGTAAFSVRVPSSVPSPGLALHADFMASGDSVPVPLVPGAGSAPPPAAPVVTAQAALLEDPSVGTSRATWRVQLTVSEVGGGRRGGEPLTVWTDPPTAVQLPSGTFPVSAAAPVTVLTDLVGELAVVLPADSLVAPAVFVRTAAMATGDALVVHPDEAVHRRLATLTVADLTTVRPTASARPGAVAPATALLEGELAGRAGDVVAVLGTVMSAVPAGEAVGLGLGAGRIDAMRPSASVAGADEVTVRRARRGRRPVRPLDVAGLVRCLDGGAGLRVTVGPDSAGSRVLADAAAVSTGRAELGDATPELGGLFDWVKNAADTVGNTVVDTATTVGNTVADTATTVGNTVANTATTVGNTVANTATTVGNTVVDAANTVAHTTTDTVDVLVSVADDAGRAINDGVRVVIRTASGVLDTVITTVEEAVSVVLEFLVQVGLEIWKVVQFLMGLFDWEEILKTHRLLQALFTSGIGVVRDAVAGDGLTSGLRALGEQADEVVRAHRADPRLGMSVQAFDGVLGDQLGRLHTLPFELDGHPPVLLDESLPETGGELIVRQAEPGERAVDGPAPQPVTAAALLAAASGVQAGVLQSCVLAAASGPAAATQPSVLPQQLRRPAGGHGPVVPPSLGAAGDSALDSLLRLPALLTDPAAMTPEAMLDALQDVAADLVSGALGGLADAVETAQDGVLAALDAGTGGLQKPIDVPLVSELYAWLTGDELTLLDAICLALAVPVNLAWGVANLARGESGSLADVAGALPGLVRGAGAPPALGAGVHVSVTISDEQLQTAAMVLRTVLASVLVPVRGAADVATFLSASAPGGGGPAADVGRVASLFGFGGGNDAGKVLKAWSFLLGAVVDTLDGFVLKPVVLEGRLQDAQAAVPAGLRVHLAPEHYSIPAIVLVVLDALKFGYNVLTRQPGPSSSWKAGGAAALDWAVALASLTWFLVRLITMLLDLHRLEQQGVASDAIQAYRLARTAELLDLWVGVLGFAMNETTIRGIRDAAPEAFPYVYGVVIGLRTGLRGSSLGVYSAALFD